MTNLPGLIQLSDLSNLGASPTQAGLVQLTHDLGGTSTAPVVTGIQDVAISTTAPSIGQTLVATSSTAASWQTPPSGGITALTGGVTAAGSGSVVATVVTNANLTGPITSTGNVTAVASQTGTGNTFVMATSPTLITPNIGTPSAGVVTNLTGTGAFNTTGTAGTVTVAAQPNITSLGTMAASLNMGNNLILNLLDPTAPQDAATKNYVDSVAQGLDVKASVQVIASSNITLSGTQTIDGVAVSVGNRVLAVGQTSAVNNGIYVVASGAWARSSDLPTGYNASGVFALVEEGTSYAGSGWVCNNASGSAVVGTNPLTFVRFSAAGNATPGGSSSQIQFNSSGAFAGDSYFTFTDISAAPTLVLGDSSNVSSPLLQVGSLSLDHSLLRPGIIVASGVSDQARINVTSQPSTSGQQAVSAIYISSNTTASATPTLSTTTISLASTAVSASNSLSINSFSTSNSSQASINLDAAEGVNTGNTSGLEVHVLGNNFAVATSTTTPVAYDFFVSSSTGNVGIGRSGSWSDSTLPTATLDVVGSGYISGSVSVCQASGGTLTVGNATYSSGLSINNVAFTINTPTVGYALVATSSTAASWQNPRTVNVTTRTANYTAAATDDVILANATSGNIVVTLAAASGLTGHVYRIKKIDSSTNTVTITPNGSNKIDNASTVVMSVQYQSYEIVSDGSNWWVV